MEAEAKADVVAAVLGEEFQEATHALITGEPVALRFERVNNWVKKTPPVPWKSQIRKRPLDRSKVKCENA